MSLRYSIYKVQPFVLLSFVRSELLYSSTSCRTCQELFWFFRSFSTCRCAPSFCFSSRNFLIIPHSIQPVKNFFRSFSSFCCFGIFYAALPDSLDIIPPRPEFVKHFLQKTSIFFGGFNIRTLVSGRKMIADFCQRVPGVIAGFLLHCQISQTYHTA